MTKKTVLGRAGPVTADRPFLRKYGLYAFEVVGVGCKAGMFRKFDGGGKCHPACFEITSSQSALIVKGKVAENRRDPGFDGSMAFLQAVRLCRRFPEKERGECFFWIRRANQPVLLAMWPRDHKSWLVKVVIDFIWVLPRGSRFFYALK